MPVPRARWTRLIAPLLAVALLAVFSSSAFAETPPDREARVAKVLELVNAERAKSGARPLTLNNNLNTAAQGYAELLSGTTCFEHTCGPVAEPSARGELAGYTNWNRFAENIAAGQQTPEAVMTAWMSSDGHRRNILNPDYSEIGIGVAVSNGRFRVYWSQSFGNRSASSAPAPAFQPVPEPVAEPAPEPEVEEAPAEMPTEGLFFEEEAPAE
jgi:uncharacterized protein YkwD